MKRRNGSFLCVFSVLIIILITTQLAGADPRYLKTTTVDPLAVEIYDAYYADLDSDGFEDDINIFVSFTASYSGYYRASFILSLELPSGTTYYFSLEAWMDLQVGQPVNIVITTLNTATEPGWYLASLDGFVRGSTYGAFDISSYLIFDPPTGQGSGNPTAYVTVL